MQEAASITKTQTSAHDEGGLTAQAAKAQLAKFGYNEQAPARRAAGLIQILLLFANPLVIILNLSLNFTLAPANDGASKVKQ